METQVSLTSLIPRCNDIIDESTVSTLDERVSEVLSSDSSTELKLPGPNENPKSDVLPKLVETIPTQPYKEFVTTDLKLWTFTHNGIEHTARHSPADVWIDYFSEYADLDPDADWTDTEERADFLMQLWEFCAAEKLSFPLTEKLNVE